MGLWWTHLANASVAVFHGSLEQFSAWAAAPAGLECLVAWLKRMPALGEDLLLLQVRVRVRVRVRVSQPSPSP